MAEMGLSGVFGLVTFDVQFRLRIQKVFWMARQYGDGTEVPLQHHGVFFRWTLSGQDAFAAQVLDNSIPELDFDTICQGSGRHGSVS